MNRLKSFLSLHKKACKTGACHTARPYHSAIRFPILLQAENWSLALGKWCQFGEK